MHRLYCFFMWFGVLAVFQRPCKADSMLWPLLVEKWFSPHQMSKNSQDLLMQAVVQGDRLSVQSILETGAPIDFTDEQGLTVLWHAVIHRQESIASMLIDHGAGVAITDKRGVSLLHSAATIGSEPVIRLLVERGAAINAPDNNRRTPLHYAALNSNDEAIQYLVAHGGYCNLEHQQVPSPEIAYRQAGCIARLANAIKKNNGQLLDATISVYFTDMWSKVNPLIIDSENLIIEANGEFLDRLSDEELKALVLVTIKYYEIRESYPLKFKYSRLLALAAVVMVESGILINLDMSSLLALIDRLDNAIIQGACYILIGFTKFLGAIVSFHLIAEMLEKQLVKQADLAVVNESNGDESLKETLMKIILWYREILEDRPIFEKKFMERILTINGFTAIKNLGQRFDQYATQTSDLVNKLELASGK